MEPTVRSPWIESAIITDRVRNVAFGLPNSKNSRQPTGIWPLKTLPRGTEFLDAETGGLNRPERSQAPPETERAERCRRKYPQKRPIQGRPWDSEFGRTGWWRMQSRQTVLQRRNRGFFENFRPKQALSVPADSGHRNFHCDS